MAKPLYISPAFLDTVKQRFGVPKHLCRRLIMGYRAGTPFGRIYTTTGVDMAAINAIFTLRWQEALETTPKRSRRWAEESPPPQKRRSSTALKPAVIRQIQELSKLGVTRSDIRDYLKLPNQEFAAAWDRAFPVMVKLDRRGRIIVTQRKR